MKKKIGVILVVLIGFVVVVMARGIKSRRQWNAEVPDNVLSIDSSKGFVVANNLDVGGTTSLDAVNIDGSVVINASLPLTFSVLVNTTTTPPTAGGQLIISTTFYRLMLSTGVGGIWYTTDGK